MRMNILVYAFDVESKHHKKAKEVIRIAIENGGMVLSTRNLLEFYSIATKKIPVPVTPENAYETIDTIPETPEIMIINAGIDAAKNAVKT